MKSKRDDIDLEFDKLVAPLSRQGRVRQMRSYPQHGHVSTYDHALRVARTAMRWSRLLRLNASETELVRGALLHDYYLYDWHDPVNVGHATKHPLRALRNAERDFELTDRERNVIESHMWPLPPTRVPQCREAWVVCAADKWCSLEEALFMR